MTRLEALKQSEENATPGPWDKVYGEVSWAPLYAVTVADGKVWSPTSDRDADFIAACRTEVPWLLDRVEELMDAAERELAARKRFELTAESVLLIGQASDRLRTALERLKEEP